MRHLVAELYIGDSLIATGNEEHTINAVVDEQDEYALFDIEGTNFSVAVIPESDALRLLFFNLETDGFSRIEEFINRSSRIEKLLS